MLTTIIPNATSIAPTTIRSHGSETRTAPGHNPVEAKVQQAVANVALAVGLDAGTILDKVNAEAATAGNRTILQTLALAVAAQLNISRRSDETMEDFFLRIAAALDELPDNEQLALEIRTGLKALKVQIPELSAALKQPDGALAARLSAAAEAPLATPQKTAAAAATTSYLQEGAGVTRAAETMAMGTQAKTNAEGNGLFSSGTTPPLPQEKQPADAKGLQTQLKTMFEPGVAETRIEIAAKVAVPNVLILGSTESPDEPVAQTGAAPKQQPALAEQAKASVGGQAVEQIGDHIDAKAALLPDTAKANIPARADPAAAVAGNADSDIEAKTPAAPPAQPDNKLPEARAEARPHSLPTPHNNNTPGIAAGLRTIAREIVEQKVQNEERNAEKNDRVDRRMQTLLTLKGFAEVVSSLPARAAELFALPADPAQLKPRLQPSDGATADGGGMPMEAAEAGPEAMARKAAMDGRHAPPSVLADDDGQADLRKIAGRPEGVDPQAVIKAAEQEKTALMKTASGPEGVPFAYASLQPAKEEFNVDAAEEQPHHEDEGDNGEDDEPEDADARRERLARQATDDLLRAEPEAEPELTITRDSSQSDRAYALYQRMGGF